MSDNELIKILKELNSQMRFLNTKVASLNASFDKILKKYKDFEKSSPAEAVLSR